MKNEIQSPSFFKNPFVVESPERLSPQDIVNLFISNYTRVETIKQRKHTFIWGSRGSGKSMMLRYLEPQCQAIVNDGIEKFLNSAEPFIAIYCPCKEGHLNKLELSNFDEYSRLVLNEHLLNLLIADQIVGCLKTQLSEIIKKEDLEKFAKETVSLFDSVSVSDSVKRTNSVLLLKDDPLNWLQKLFLFENIKINAFLRSYSLRGQAEIYEGTTSGYHDFLLPFIKLLSNIPILNSVPMFIMLDDADKLTKSQQSIVNTWIANRDQAYLCFKISARWEGYSTRFTRDGGIIEQAHDYSEVDVEELYTKSKTDYYEKVKLIAEKRLSLAHLRISNIVEFLPLSDKEAELFSKIKEITRKEWEEKGQPGHQADYVTRYASARLFQELARRGTRKSYAGFENMVHLSSGIVRDFLEPCYLMFDKCVSKIEDPKSILFIPPDVQNDILFAYSEEFIVKRFDEIRQDLPTEDWPRVNELTTLIESLGRLFYARLHDAESREPRLFSFTITGTLSPEVNDVLKLGIKYRYFQLRTYSTKKGGGRVYWYILNRRLCPIYKLDPTGFEGRISITAEMLQLACKDPDTFVRLRLKRKVSKEVDEQMDLFSFVEGDQD